MPSRAPWAFRSWRNGIRLSAPLSVALKWGETKTRPCRPPDPPTVSELYAAYFFGGSGGGDLENAAEEITRGKQVAMARAGAAAAGPRLPVPICDFLGSYAWMSTSWAVAAG